MRRQSRSIIALAVWLGLLQGCSSAAPAILPAPPPTSAPPIATVVAPATPVPTQVQASLALPECTFAAGQAPLTASYCMSVQLDPEAKTVAGVERITYRNPSQDRLQELWLHLYLRAFRSRDTVWMSEAGGGHRGNPVDPDELGDITVEQLALADGTDLLSTATLTDTLMRVPLPQALGPGENVDLDIRWTSKLPKVFARTGYGGRDDSFFMVGQWYPKMAVYDRGRWDTEPWHTNSEFFHDFGGYDVSITTPSEYVVAGVGTPAGEALTQGAETTVRYTAIDVTDFAFAASPDFKVEIGKAGSTEVLLYYLPEHAGSVEEYMDSATGSLLAFSEWYGAYPHPRLTVIDVPDDSGGAGGMEYPTLITGGTYDAPPGSGFVALVVSHEVGHQWWPMQTATNEAREPWLDEGLTEYSGARYMAEVGQQLDFGNVVVDMATLEYSQYDNTRLPATLPAWEYESGYGSAVYAKTALGLWTLENTVGTERFRRAMAEYLAEYRFKHPTGADFRAVLERSLGPQDWFWDEYMNGNGRIDYTARPIQTVGNNSIARVQRTGEVQAPVDIRITLADGTQRIETWDGKTADATFSFPATNRIRNVEIDPDGKLKAEAETGDNKAAAP